MLQSWRAVFTRFRALLRSDAAGVRAGFYALLLSSGGDLIAGLTLGSITGTLESLPGLLVLVPAAIGMRGNVFGALGSRLGTAVHTGTFRMSGRRDTLVGQNLAASLSMSLSVSLVLALLAKVICVAFGIENTISIADFVVISVIGGFLSSIVVMGITVFVAQVGVRRNWDLDNVTAPIVTAAGDMVTLPALFLATYRVGNPWLTTIVAVFCAAVALVALIASIRSKYPILRRIARESLPVLVLAGTIDVIAGLTIEKRFESFLVYPALLILVPPFLEDSGALGSILKRGCRPSSTSARSCPARGVCARSGRTSSSCTCTRSPCSSCSGCRPTSPRSWSASSRPGAWR